jgi:hypothetical protein
MNNARNARSLVIVTWLIANTAGSTKKAVVTVMYSESILADCFHNGFSG